MAGKSRICTWDSRRDVHLRQTHVWHDADAKRQVRVGTETDDRERDGGDHQRVANGEFGDFHGWLSVGAGLYRRGGWRGDGDGQAIGQVDGTGQDELVAWLNSLQDLHLRDIG